MSCWYNDEDPNEIFKVLEQLGEGSYGSVYKAVHTPTAKVVAVKVVPIEHEGSELCELRKEIAILEKCSSPYIVQYNGSYLHDGEMWISMEYCDAGSAADLVEATRENLQEEEIAAVCASVVKGLAYLHGQNNIHRDVKAGNILLSYSGHAKLADFGVSAQLSNTISKRKTVIGTPFWMAPEVIQESSYDGKADIWSLGITAIELADGNPPHAQMHPMRAIFLIPSRPPPTLRNPEHFSADFNDFIQQCLTKDPKERPDATDLLSHPFVRKHVMNLDSSNQKGLPIIQELVERSIDAIHCFRQVENNEDENEATKVVSTTETILKQQATMKDTCSDTMVRPAESTQYGHDDQEEAVAAGSSYGSNYATMVFNGKPDFLNDSNQFYGTMVFRGKELESSSSGTIVSKTPMPLDESEIGSADGGGDTRDEPSFMKYFRKPQPPAPLSREALQEQLEQLCVKFEADKVALEARFVQERKKIQKQIDALI